MDGSIKRWIYIELENYHRFMEQHSVKQNLYGIVQMEINMESDQTSLGQSRISQIAWLN